jgi:hypothetical protein
VRFFLFILFSVFTATGSGRADDLEYVSNAELKAEILRRETDMQRTVERLAELTEKEREVDEELGAAREGIVEIEKQAAVRVRAFYRMSRNAGSLRFFLDADSPTDAIRRINTLRRLLLDGLDARRRAGLRIAEAEKMQSRIREDGEAARAMLDMLTEAYEERLKEATARRMPVRRFRLHP